ncbi:MAG TPA: MmgE/PrpD family protein [Bordetella sp.]
MTAPTYARQLARFATATAFADLPAPLVERAKRHILDTLGAALAGSASTEARTVQAVLRQDAAGSGPARIWGLDRAIGQRDAAFANGVAAHALELDDAGGCDHSGAVVLPAVLAAAAGAPEPVSGQDFIAAVVIGYDVGRRVLEACGGYPAHNGVGWHSTATCGTFGAAAAVARLWRLDEQQCAWALGHAASFSGGLWAFIHDGTQTKKLHTGRAAEGGLLAARMATAGISGPAAVFEDVWGGFFRAFAPQTAQPEALTAELGETWKLLRCSIKPYAACRSTHASVDALLHLLANAEAGRQAAAVDVRLSQFVMNMCGGRDLTTLASAQMSMPYALAAAWVFGDANIERYLQGMRGDPRLAQAMARIRLHPDPAMADLEEPTITLSGDGMAPVSHHVPIALGAPANPLSDAQLLAKFTQLACVALPPSQAEQLADRVLRLEADPDSRTLQDLLLGHADAARLIA